MGQLQVTDTGLTFSPEVASCTEYKSDGTRKHSCKYRQLDGEDTYYVHEL